MFRCNKQIFTIFSFHRDYEHRKKALQPPCRYSTNGKTVCFYIAKTVKKAQNDAGCSDMKCHCRNSCNLPFARVLSLLKINLNMKKNYQFLLRYRKVDALSIL